MGNSYLNRGIICVLVGICFILAAVFTESALDGLLWGLAGGALGPGIGMIIMHKISSATKKNRSRRTLKFTTS